LTIAVVLLSSIHRLRKQEMKFKCKTCDKKFFSNVVFEQHSCVKAYEQKTLEQLLQEYNIAKNSAKSA
jgi:hypothetical protein